MNNLLVTPAILKDIEANNHFVKDVLFLDTYFEEMNYNFVKNGYFFFRRYYSNSPNTDFILKKLTDSGDFVYYTEASEIREILHSKFEIITKDFFDFPMYQIFSINVRRRHYENLYIDFASWNYCIFKGIYAVGKSSKSPGKSPSKTLLALHECQNDLFQFLPDEIQEEVKKHIGNVYTETNPYKKYHEILEYHYSSGDEECSSDELL